MANSWSNSIFTIDTNCNYTQLSGYKGSEPDSTDTINISVGVVITLDGSTATYNTINGPGTLAYNTPVTLTGNIISSNQAAPMLTVAATNLVTLNGNLTGGSNGAGIGITITGGTLTFNGLATGGAAAPAINITGGNLSQGTGHANIRAGTVPGLTATSGTGTIVISDSTAVAGVNGTTITACSSFTATGQIQGGTTGIGVSLVTTATTVILDGAIIRGGTGGSSYGISISSTIGTVSFSGTTCYGGSGGTTAYGVFYQKTAIWSGCITCYAGSSTISHGFHTSSLTGNLTATNGVAACYGGTSTGHGFNLATTAYAGTCVIGYAEGGQIAGSHGFNTMSCTTFTPTYTITKCKGGIVDGAYGVKILTCTNLTVVEIDTTGVGSPIVWGPTTQSWPENLGLCFLSGATYVDYRSNTAAAALNLSTTPNSIGPYPVSDTTHSIGPYPLSS